MRRSVAAGLQASGVRARILVPSNAVRDYGTSLRCKARIRSANAVVAVRLLELLDRTGIAVSTSGRLWRGSPRSSGRADSTSPLSRTGAKSCSTRPTTRPAPLALARSPARRRRTAARVRGDARQGRRRHAPRAGPGRQRLRGDPRLESPVGEHPDELAELARRRRVRISRSRRIRRPARRSSAPGALSSRIVVAGSIFLLGDVMKASCSDRDTLRNRR